MGKKPLLSISLLTSDRKDTIRKCLDSLKPLRDVVDSELIIVDTGCDEEMLQIISEYTKKIVHFTWCDDFAKARNAGLKQARGKWFMYIDDDEWLEDVAPIADFFQSGEYKDCTYARYMIRNYSDFTGKVYYTSWSTRLFRLEKVTYFKGRVHEAPVVLNGKVKSLPCYAHHYGYAYKTEEDRQQHFRRNVSLLEKMIEKEPENTRWWKQLAQEYGTVREYHKIYEICCQAIELFKEKSDPVTNLARASFYNGQLAAKEALLDYEEGIRDYGRAIQDPRNNSMCQLRLFARGAKLYFCIKDYDNCERCCHEYLSLYETLKDDREAQAEQGNIFTQDACEPDVRDFVYCFLISSGLKKHDLAALRTYFDCLGWKEKGIRLYDVGIIGEMIHAMAEHEYEEYFVHIAQYIMDRKTLRDVTMPALYAIERNAKKEDKDYEEQFRRIIRIFSQVSSEDYYIDYLKVLNANQGGNAAELPEHLGTLFGKVLNIFQLDDAVWETAERYQVELEPLFFQISFDSWKAGVVSFCEGASLPLIQKRVKLVKGIQRSENIRYSFFHIKALEARLMHGEARGNYQGLRELLAGFSEQTLQFYHTYYKQQAFEGDMDMLPDACRAAVCLDTALKREEEGNYKEALGYYKQCIGMCASLDQAVKDYSHLYADELHRGQQDPRAALKLRMMAEQVIKQIPVLVEGGQRDEAVLAVQQLRKMLPEDEKIRQLEQELSGTEISGQEGKLEDEMYHSYNCL